MSYEEIRAELAEAYHWTFDAIDGMTLEQIDSAMRRGKKQGGIPVGSNEDVLEINRNWRKYVGV